MERYLTLSKTETKFQSYLSGRFSNSEVAIPTRSLEVSTSGEQVTFLLKPKTLLGFKAWLEILPRLFRFNLLSLSFAPVLVVWASSGATALTWSSISAALGLLCFHCGIFALNDYVDHIRGLDRVSDTAGSRVIQSGSVPAYLVARIAVGILVLAVVFGLPAVLTDSNLLSIGLAAFTLGVFGYSFARSGWRRVLVGSFSVFVTFGPLLTLSAFELFQRPITAENFSEFILLSTFFGWAASLYSRSRQLGSAMVDHLAKVHTFATRVGFDRARQFLIFDCLTFIGFFFYLWSTQFSELQLLVLALAILWVGLKLVALVFKIKSPLSSAAQAVPSQVLHVQMAMTLALIFGYLWNNI